MDTLTYERAVPFEPHRAGRTLESGWDAASCISDFSPIFGLKPITATLQGEAQALRLPKGIRQSEADTGSCLELLVRTAAYRYQVTLQFQIA